MIYQKQKDMKKFHAIFGQVEVKSTNDRLTVLVLADGTEKTVLTKYTNLSDTDITDVKAIAKENKRQAIKAQPKVKLAEMVAEANDHKQFDLMTKRYK